VPELSPGGRHGQLAVIVWDGKVVFSRAVEAVEEGEARLGAAMDGFDEHAPQSADQAS
jgi:hypothetical protein